MMIKAIIFDAFGTLFKVTGGASAKTIISYIENAGFDVNEAEFISEWKAFYKEKTKNGCAFSAERDIFIARIEMFYDRYGVLRNAEEDADALLREAHTRRVYDDVPYALCQLKNKFKIFIGSNTDNSVLNSVIKLNGICVDGVYTSEDLRTYKPSHHFYRLVLKYSNLAPSEVLFVGDSLTDDVMGPQTFGIKTCLVNRSNAEKGTYEPDFIIKNLAQLSDLDILKR